MKRLPQTIYRELRAKMADTERVTVYLDADAAELLTQRAGPRGRGAYISELIRNDKGPLLPGQGVSERIEEKLDKLIGQMGG